MASLTSLYDGSDTSDCGNTAIDVWLGDSLLLVWSSWVFSNSRKYYAHLTMHISSVANISPSLFLHRKGCYELVHSLNCFIFWNITRDFPARLSAISPLTLSFWVLPCGFVDVFMTEVCASQHHGATWSRANRSFFSRFRW